MVEINRFVFNSLKVKTDINLLMILQKKENRENARQKIIELFAHDQYIFQFPIPEKNQELR
jgi:hypothetical protein